MVRSKTWLLALVILLSCLDALGQERAFVSISGGHMSLFENNGECAFLIKGSDVQSRGPCSLKSTDRISITTTVLSFDISVSALKIGSTGYVDSESQNTVDYIGGVSILDRKFEDVFIIQSLRSKPYTMHFKVLFSLQHGIIGFQKSVPDGFDSIWIARTIKDDRGVH